jgi:hypothetical protein
MLLFPLFSLTDSRNLRGVSSLSNDEQLSVSLILGLKLLSHYECGSVGFACYQVTSKVSLKHAKEQEWTFRVGS